MARNDPASDVQGIASFFDSLNNIVPGLHPDDYRALEYDLLSIE